jgi:hypothetical protein
MFTICVRDNRPVYSARQPQPNAVDIRFADVRFEDLLQHDVTQLRRVDWPGRVIVQEFAVYHSPVPRHGARFGDRESAVTDGRVIV